MASREYLRAIALPIDADLPIPRKAWQAALRRSFDFLCAAMGLAVLAPILAAIAIAIKLDDGGPVLYLQDRVGHRLRKFRLMKFRSMFHGAAEGICLTAPGDTRVTRVGRLLRRYKLDELPQLMNVLRGEMQLVGVRPQVQRFVDLFPKEYAELLQAPPGITDPASISFRDEESLFHVESIEDLYVAEILPFKLKIALNYSRKRNFFSDLGIIFRTILGMGLPPAMRGDKKFHTGASAPAEFTDVNFG
jgi:lipopolysaccharide/colanic/teichoic acid biosynthesis glycosyltransferase